MWKIQLYADFTLSLRSRKFDFSCCAWPKPPWRIIVIHILSIFSLSSFCVVCHFRLSLLNNFYCDILHLYLLWFLHKFSNIRKPEEAWYGQPKYCYKKTIHVVMNQLCSSLCTYWNGSENFIFCLTHESLSHWHSVL